ncbi:MAG: hypothetical protein EBY25_12270, partial [Betaproteobacteria bacterium]|nr:hypothetical protein [Betaproteobacteria bacterium]
MNPTGGLLWHARAWRRQGAWRGTCGQIGQWLGQVRPSSRELLIIGASAGWMMPSAWLQRFEKVSTFDIDRWAAPLFRLRHGAVLRRSGVDLRCHTSDAIGRLDEVLAENPRAAVLFDNILGQLRFQQPSLAQAAAQIEKITRSMRTREWGSVHDAYSGPVSPGKSASRAAYGHQSVQPAYLSAFETDHGAVSLAPEFTEFSAQFKAQGVWLDHLTSNVFPRGTPVHHIAWPYAPCYSHWLQ